MFDGFLPANKIKKDKNYAIPANVKRNSVNTFPVLNAFIVNVKLSAGWIDLMGNPI